MPYSRKKYGSKRNYKKFKRCVRKVGKKYPGKVNPFAVCRHAIYQKRLKHKKRRK